MKTSLGKITLITLLGLSFAHMAIAADKPTPMKKQKTKVSKEQTAYAKKIFTSKSVPTIDGSEKKSRRTKASDAEPIPVNSICTYDENFSTSLDGMHESSFFKYIAPNGDTYQFTFDPTGEAFNPSDATEISIQTQSDDKLATTAAYPSSDPSSTETLLSFSDNNDDGGKNNWKINSINNITTGSITNVFNAILGLESYKNDWPDGLFTITSTDATVSSNDGTPYPQYMAMSYIAETNTTQNDLYFSNELFYKDSSNNYVAYALCTTIFAS